MTSVKECCELKLKDTTAQADLQAGPGFPVSSLINMIKLCFHFPIQAMADVGGADLSIPVSSLYAL